MQKTVEYYLGPQSPWAYLGHARFVQMTQQAGAVVQLRPVDMGGKVFPASGGLPVGQRPPQRQSYRLVELARWRDFLKLPLNVKPRFFPVQGDDASKLIIAVDLTDGTAAALKLTGAVLSAVWAQERDIHNPATLKQLLVECGLPANRMEEAQAPTIQASYDLYAQLAIAAGVFGSPTYVVGGEVFWGQDRLDFLERRLA